MTLFFRNVFLITGNCLFFSEIGTILKKNTVFFGNARPKSNARAHSGLSYLKSEMLKFVNPDQGKLYTAINQSIDQSINQSIN